MAEYSGEEGCQKDSHAGEKSGLHRNRLGRIPLGSETSIEHYEDERGRTDILRKFLVFKVYGDKPVVAENYSQQYECEEGRDTYAERKIVQPDADQDDRCNQNEKGSLLLIEGFYELGRFGAAELNHLAYRLVGV